MAEKINYPCPCGGKVKWTKEKVIMEGVDCGTLDVEVCNKCGEHYLPEESMKIVEQKLKEAGLWGVEREKVSFWKSGGSVILRIPSNMAKMLGLKSNSKGTIYTEGKRKLIVEI